MKHRKLVYVTLVQANQRSITRAFNRCVLLMDIYDGHFILKEVMEAMSDSRDIFRPKWFRPPMVKRLTKAEATCLTDVNVIALLL